MSSLVSNRPLSPFPPPPSSPPRPSRSCPFRCFSLAGTVQEGLHLPCSCAHENPAAAHPHPRLHITSHGFVLPPPPPPPPIPGLPSTALLLALVEATQIKCLLKGFGMGKMTRTDHADIQHLQSCMQALPDLFLAPRGGGGGGRGGQPEAVHFS